MYALKYVGTAWPLEGPLYVGPEPYRLVPLKQAETFYSQGGAMDRFSRMTFITTKPYDYVIVEVQSQPAVLVDLGPLERPSGR